jgi:hypothetical protein
MNDDLEENTDADIEARRTAIAIFEQILSSCKGKNINDHFKSGGGCLVCDFDVKTKRHLSTDSHQRRVICTELLDLKDSIQANSIESLTRLRDLLRTPSSSGGGSQHLLLDMSRQNWSDKFKAGPHQSRGHGFDVAKLWFGSYLEKLESFCGSAESSQDTQPIKSSILAVIGELRAARPQVALQTTL